MAGTYPRQIPAGLTTRSQQDLWTRVSDRYAQISATDDMLGALMQVTHTATEQDVRAVADAIEPGLAAEFFGPPSTC